MVASRILKISERSGKQAIFAEIRTLEVCIGRPRSPRSFSKWKNTAELLELLKRRLFESANKSYTY